MNTSLRFGKLIHDSKQASSDLGPKGFAELNVSLGYLTGKPLLSSPQFRGPDPVSFNIQDTQIAQLEQLGFDVQVTTGQKDIGGDLFRAAWVTLVKDGKPIEETKTGILAKDLGPYTSLTYVLSAAIDKYIQKVTFPFHELHNHLLQSVGPKPPLVD